MPFPGEASDLSEDGMRGLGAPLTGTGEDDFDYLCVNGHDLCHGGASAGPSCPYCERVPLEADDDASWDEDDEDLGAECGRWDQNAPGGMWKACRLAGTEFCELDCPHRDRSALRESGR